MADSPRHRRLASSGCYSETAQLTKVIVCPPSNFAITEPINYVQELYHSDGLPKPRASVMEEQHEQMLSVLWAHGVDVETVEAIPGLPYQHATRDVGVVIGDTIVLSSLRERTRQLEAQIMEPVLHRCGLRVVTPDRGFVEGGDVVVDGERLWVGVGKRTNEWGVDFLYQTFGRDYAVIPLRFDPHYTHLDTIFGVVGRGDALLYEPAFEPESLARIREVYPSVVLLNEEEQQNAGANVLSLDRNTVLAIEENGSVNEQLVELGYKVLTVRYSEIIKSGGSVRCDTLPVERLE